MSFNFSFPIKMTICLLFLMALGSCHSSTDKNQEDPVYNEALSKSLSRSLNLSHVAKAHLISEAEEDLSNWSQFLTLKVEMEKFEDYSLQDIVDSGSSLLKPIEKVRDSLPEKFKSTSVESRLNVLYTKTKILDQYLKYQQNDTLELQKMGSDVFEAYENLEIQLNETYLKDFSEFDFDMDQRQDSIQEARRNKAEKNNETP